MATLTWVMLGALTDSSVEVVLKTASATAVSVEIDGTSVTGTPDASGITHLVRTGLDPDTAYSYAVSLDGVQASTATFRTAPRRGSPASFAFTFGSCMANTASMTTFTRMLDHDPLMLIHLGDFHYANPGDNHLSIDQIRAAYDVQIVPPVTSALGQLPIAYIYDNHDWAGPSGPGGSLNPVAASVQSVYRQYFPLYDLPGDQDGAGYQTWVIGRVRFLLLDGWSQAEDWSLPDRPEKTRLGDAQKAWLKSWLLTAEEPVKIICSSALWRPTINYQWGGFQNELAEINAFVVDNDIQGVYGLAGDVHLLAADDGTDNAGHIPFAEASPFNQSAGSLPGVPFTDGPYPSTSGANVQQYGLINVTDDGGDQITVDFTGYSVAAGGASETAVISMSTMFPATPVAAEAPRPLRKRSAGQWVVLGERPSEAQAKATASGESAKRYADQLLVSERARADKTYNTSRITDTLINGVPDGSFELGQGIWLPTAGVGSFTTPDVPDAYVGGKVGRFTFSGTSGGNINGFNITYHAIAPGQVWTGQLRARSTVGSRQVRINLFENTINLNHLGAWVTTTPAWAVASIVGAKLSAGVSSIRVDVNINSGAAGDVVELDAVMMTQTNYVPDYADGDSDDWEWLGTPHQSPSRKKDFVVSTAAPPAGTAAALPALPSGYIRHVMPDGSVWAIPGYQL